MTSKGSRLWLTLACAMAILGGCTSIPPAPQQAQAQSKSGEDEYEGWLFKSLTGKKTAATAPQAPPNATAAPSGVQQASATLPSTPGQWIPGPASVTARGTTPASPEFSLPVTAGDVAGPPPAIPAELPAPPAGTVSIKDAKSKTEKKGFEWSDLAPDTVYNNMKVAAGYGPNEKIARAAKAEGDALFRAGKYMEAAPKFATAASRWPDTPLEEDALFLKGDSEFFSDQYPKAHDTYGGLMKKYPNTRYLDKVVSREFSIGRYWEQLQDAKPSWPITPNLTDNGRPLFDTFGYAVQAYEHVYQNDPTGPLADASLMALGNAYFRRGQYDSAAFNYDRLRKEYRNSKFQPMAHLLGLQAKMRVYQGTMYSGVPLKEAEKIAKTALAQYGMQLGPERDRVAQAEIQIVEELANREFTLGQYYERRSEFGAARIYYQTVIKDYPATSKAKEAKARLEAIRNEPDKPVDHFKWLTGAFEPKT